MSVFIRILIEYPIQFALIFGAIILAILTLVNRKRMSHKSKWFVIALLLGCFLMIFDSFLMISNGLQINRP